MGEGPDQEMTTSTRNQYIAALTMNIMVFCHGCAIGWVSPMLPVLSGQESPLSAPLTDSESSWVGSLICIGGMLGTPVYGWISDRFGRKRTGLISAIPYLISWIMKLTWRTPVGIISARFVAGLGGSGIFFVTPTYCVEIATVATRGRLGSLMIFFVNVGIVFMYTIGAFMSYNVVLFIMIAVPVVYFLLMLKMPETPAYLVKNGRHQEAAESIAWLRGLPVKSLAVEKELSSLRFEIDLANDAPKTSANVIRDKSSGADENSVWKMLFSSRPTFRAFLACFAILTGQVSLGIFAVITYANEIFRQAGTELSPNVSSIIVGLLQFFGSVLASSLIEKAGRKILLISSCAIVSLSMFTMGTFFYVRQAEYDVSNIGWIPVTAMSFAVCIFAMGIGPIPYLLLSELISVRARSLASSIILVWVWLTSFAVAQFFGPMVDLIGISAVFWCFASSGVFCILLAFFCIPETKGKAFEDIVAFYSGGKGSGEKENAEQLL